MTEDGVNVKRAYNNDHLSSRARVEVPFGFVKLKFRALDRPWTEPESQLDNLVTIALAFLNWLKRHT